MNKTDNLVSIFIDILPPEEAQYERVIAQKCAMICADLVLKELKKVPKYATCNKYEYLINYWENKKRQLNNEENSNSL